MLKKNRVRLILSLTLLFVAILIGYLIDYNQVNVPIEGTRIWKDNGLNSSSMTNNEEPRIIDHSVFEKFSAMLGPKANYYLRLVFPQLTPPGFVEVAGPGVAGIWNGGLIRGITHWRNSIVIAKAGGEIWQYRWNKWVKIGGDGVRGSWEFPNENYKPSRANALISHPNGNLYAGVGKVHGNGYAEVWEYNGDSWLRIFDKTQCGECQIVYSLALDDQDRIIAGTLNEDKPGYGIVFRYDTNSKTWDTIRPSDDSISAVYSLANYQGHIYAGTMSRKQGNAKIYKMTDDKNWELIGGGEKGIWSPTFFVEHMKEWNNKLVICLGHNYGTKDHSIWAWDNQKWTPLGGDLPSILVYSHQNNVLESYKGDLYLGIGVGAGAEGAETGPAIMRYNLQNDSWETFASSRVSEKWPNRHWIYQLLTVNDSLWIGFANAEGSVWRYSKN